VRIITWNVNSILARLPNVEDFLKRINPDVLLLQELKCEEHVFPESLAELGYNTAIYGQKTYNGVAILSKYAIEDVQKGIPGFEDVQARYIEAFTGGVRVASIYVPNGQTIESPAYQYKLNFLEHLYVHAQKILNFGEKIVLGGDFNIAPTDNDVHDPIAWRDQVLCSAAEREAFFKLQHLGFTDALKQTAKDSNPPFTWWDYRKGSFAKDDGLRIDHLLLSASAADCLQTTKVHKTERALEKASDHAPVECVLV
jgi:exodeoxyribonuclease-3